MILRASRAAALIGVLAAGCLAAPAFAQTQAAPQPPANRLALVIGEAAYNGDALPTAGADAALVAQTLGADGFDVTELHDLDTPNLASNYQAFLAKVAAAPPGAAVTVYLAGLGVAVGCDDYLLPVDARIQAASDVPRIALSMTRVMNDLAQTSSQLRLIMLDGARPIPPSVSAASFPRGLIPLAPPAATTFGISAEIHDLEAPPKPGDANDAYASAFALVAQQPLTDVETSMRQVRVVAHQATSGAQTPWQATDIAMPPFTFPLNADPALMQTALANLPSSTAPLSSLDAESAYWAAIWRNSIPDYQAYLAAFSSSAPAEQTARIAQLLDLLRQPNPQCEAMAAPALMAGPACPDGFIPEDGFNGAYCVPLAPPPVLDCPAGFSTIATDDGMGCSPLIPPPVLTCPPFFHVFGLRPYCAPDTPPPFCPPGFRPIRHEGALACVRVGQLPPGCPIGAHPVWTGDRYACGGDPPPPSPCANGKPVWRDGRWACVNPPAPRCPNGEVAQWADGREVCRVPRLPGGTIRCPQGYGPSGQGGTICAPLRAGPPNPQPGAGSVGCVAGRPCPIAPLKGPNATPKIPGAGPIHCPPGSAGCPPTGLPAPSGASPPLKCPNGEVAQPGKGCPNGAGATTPTTCPSGTILIAGRGCTPTAGHATPPTPTLRCPAGWVKGANGCEPLHKEQLRPANNPAPVIHTPPPVVHPIVPSPGPHIAPPPPHPAPVVAKPAVRPHCGGNGEPPCKP